MAPSIVQAKILTAVVATGLVSTIITMRFCGALGLPPKPPPPVRDVRDLGKVLAASASTNDAWQQFARRDASSAAIANFDPASLTKVMPYASDEQRHVLTPGEPAIELAGLMLTATVEAGDRDQLLVLTIDNPSDSAVAYQVVTSTSLGLQRCTSRTLLPHNAIVIAPHSREKRSECLFAPGMTLVVTRVDAMHVPPLSAWYLGRLQPGNLAMDARSGKGHRPTALGCSITPPQSLIASVQRGLTSWRDLADFYARHRCETYEFPISYKHFERDAERDLPAG